MAYTTIKKPSDYFNTKLYTGDGNSSRSITGVGFATDMVWLKGRTTTYSHRLVDKLRTGTYPKLLYPNETSAESEDVNNFVSLDSDGFTIGVGNAVNQSGQTYVAWNWLANGSGSSNSDGSITSTVSANTTSGFSIVSYTGNGTSGATVGHGLGEVPVCIIFKNRDLGTDRWNVYHHKLDSSAPENYRLFLNATDARQDVTYLNDTAPTSTLITLGGEGETNRGSDNIIAYCFAEKKGFSKFGSWTGADGVFIYTGFKPAFILCKNATNGAGYDWCIFDNKRETFNDGANNLLLRPNASDAEQTITSAPIDFLSNGFKIYGTDNTVNGSGETMIYMAFAEEPLVGDNPATAR
jgi:hypothetical protein